MIYALDTNVISDFLQGEGNVEANFKSIIIESNGTNHYAIPYLVYYELKCWLNHEPDEEKIEHGKTFDRLFAIVENRASITPAVWKKAAEIFIELKNKGRKAGSMDIIIAAFCLVNNYTLVSNNVRDFRNIDGLKFTNWF